MAYRPRSTPWRLDDSEFYELETFLDEMKFLLRYAILAPSGHNTQPWSFAITDDGIEVYADYSRRLPIIDPIDRELLMSVGAAITNFRVAASHFGFDTSVLYETRPEESLPVAFITVRETCAPDVTLARLFPAIKQRHTNRRRFSKRAIAPAAMAQIRDLVATHHDLLELVSEPAEKEFIAGLVAKGDQLQLSNEGLRHELTSWFRPSHSASGDGIPVDALGIPEALSGAAPAVMREVNPGPLQSMHDETLTSDAPLLMIVKADDSRIHLLQAGETLEIVLLTLALHGVQYSFMNQPVEVTDLREKLATLTTGDAPPQLVLRLGYARAVRKSMPRRPLEAVLT